MNETETQPWTRLSADPNADGSITISDLGGWLADIALLPGDTAIYCLLTYAPSIAAFFELGESDYGGPFAIGASVTLWLIALIALGMIFNLIRNVDRHLTAFVANLYDDTKTRLRILKRRGSAWLGALLQARARKREEMRVEPLMLEQLEKAVLRCLTKIDEGAVLTIDEIAERLDRPAGDIRSTYRRLNALALIEHAKDSFNKREGYRITTAGQMYLIGS